MSGTKISGALPLPRRTLSRKQIFIVLFILISIIVVSIIIFGSLFAYHNSSEDGTALAFAIIFVVIGGLTYIAISICYMSCCIFMISIVKKNKSTDRELQFLNAIPFYENILQQLRLRNNEMIIVSTQSDYESKKWAKGYKKNTLNSMLIPNQVSNIGQEVKKMTVIEGQLLVVVIIAQQYSIQKLTQQIEEFERIINKENGQILITMKSTVKDQFIQAVNNGFQTRVYEYGEDSSTISYEEYINCVQMSMFNDQSVNEELVKQVYQKIDKTKLVEIQDTYETHFNYLGRKC